MRYTVKLAGVTIAQFEYMTDALKYIRTDEKPEYLRLFMNGEPADYLLNQ